MRATFLQCEFERSQSLVPGQHLASLPETRQPFDDRLVIATFRGRPFLLKPLQSEIEGTQMPWRSFEFEP